MPFTAPALLANFASLTGDASLDASPREAKPSRATSTAATPSAIGNRRLIVILLSFDPNYVLNLGLDAEKENALWRPLPSIREKCSRTYGTLCSRRRLANATSCIYGDGLARNRGTSAGRAGACRRRWRERCLPCAGWRRSHAANAVRCRSDRG